MKNEVGVALSQIPPDKLICTLNLIPPNQILREFLTRLNMPPFQQQYLKKSELLICVTNLEKCM